MNAILNFTPDSSAFNATLAFNVQGEKLILTTTGGLPDIYQQPSPQLDFTANYRFAEHFAIGFRGRNLLNPENLFGGNGGNLIGNLVQQVGSSITDKINSGEIRQDELVKDAFSLMSRMQNGSDNNPIINSSGAK